MSLIPTTKEHHAAGTTEHARTAEARLPVGVKDVHGRVRSVAVCTVPSTMPPLRSEQQRANVATPMDSTSGRVRPTDLLKRSLPPKWSTVSVEMHEPRSRQRVALESVLTCEGIKRSMGS